MRLGHTRVTTVHFCRNQEKSQKAAAAVKSASGNDRVHALSADLSSLEAVRALAADVKAVAPDGLDVLVNNAGGHQHVGCQMNPSTLLDGNRIPKGSACH